MSLREKLELKRLLLPYEVPKVAYPTILLCFVCVSAHLYITHLYYHRKIKAIVATAINAIACFVVFTPMHDACHGSIAKVESKMRWLNDMIGYISACLFPAPYAAFKYCHLQHHKHTNDPDKDPDHYVSTGPKLLLPLKWFSIELKYYSMYLPLLNSRPTSEAIAAVGQLLAIVFVLLLSSRNKHLLDTALTTWIIPGRISLGFLSYSFDYLPHRNHDIKRSDDEAKATSVTSLFGNCTWILTWLLLHQNYHNIHHIWPYVPFYLYSVIWNAGKEKLINLGTEIKPIIP